MNAAQRAHKAEIRARYEKRRNTGKIRAKCPCTRPAVAWKGQSYVCQHCLDIERSLERAEERDARSLPAASCGVPYSGLPIHSLNYLTLS